MLEKYLYDSWKSHMEFYMKNKENRRMILDSVLNGPLVWPTIVQKDGTTRKKTYVELFATKKLQANCDLKATNIVLQVFHLMCMLLAIIIELQKRYGTVLSFLCKARNCKKRNTHTDHQTSFVPPITYHSPQASTQPMTEFPQMDSGLAILVFSQGDDLIACLNKAMAFLTDVASSSQPKRPRNVAWLKKKAMLAEVQESRQILDEEQLVFLADPGIPDGQATQTTIPNNAAFQTEDPDAYDFDCDDVQNAKAVLMANFFNYGYDVISEVPHPEPYYKDMKNQSVHAMQDFEQILVVDFTDNEITSDNNIIPYSQYSQETQQEAVQDNKLYAQQDSVILFLIEEMSKQMINHLTVAMPMIDDEETLILKEVSRSKMLEKQNDLISKENKAFWLQNSNLNTKQSDNSPGRIDSPSELPKDKFCDNQNALEILKSFENNNLKAQLQDKDTTICKLKDIIKSLRENNKEKKGNHDITKLETINEKLENDVAKFLSENERLCKDINLVKQDIYAAGSESHPPMLNKEN
nr:hypothetical protein [Tanacetum cinerariifolium]